MVTLNPYLNFQGNTEEAFKFYKSVFGGEFAFIQRFNEAPAGAGMTPKEANGLMHVALPIGGNMLMGTDAVESMGQSVKPGNNIHLCLSPDSKTEADRLFKALSAGGTPVMPMADQSWGAYFGMATDKFGISWMINQDNNNK